MLPSLVLFGFLTLAAAKDSTEMSSDDVDIWKVQMGTSSIGRIKYEDGEVILYANQGKPSDIFFTPFPYIDPLTSQCQDNILSGHVELSLSVKLYTPQLIESVRTYLKEHFRKRCVENGTCDVSLLPMNAIRLTQKGRRANTTQQMYTVNDEWHSNTLLLQEIKFVIYAANESICEHLLSSIVKRCYLSSFEIHYSLNSEKTVESRVEITTSQVSETAMFNQIQSQFSNSDSVALTGNDFKQLVNEVIDKITMKLRVQEGFDSQIQEPISLDKLLERQLQSKQVRLQRMDDEFWNSLYWTPELTRPDRLAKVVNTILRNKSTDNKHFVYDRKAVKNMDKRDLTQHDIDRLEQLDKWLANYARSSQSSNQYSGSSSGGLKLDFKLFSFGGKSSDKSSSQHEQADDLKTTNDTMHHRKIDKNFLNTTKIETHEETQYELARNDVTAYLNELSDHIHLEGEIIRPKPIDAHLIKLNKLRTETKLFSHSVFVRTRRNVHVLPLRCPSANNKFTDNSVASQHHRLADELHQLKETVNNLQNQVFRLQKQSSKQITQAENASNKVNELSKQLTKLENDKIWEQNQPSSPFSKLSRLEQELNGFKNTTSERHSELSRRIISLERSSNSKPSPMSSFDLQKYEIYTKLPVNAFSEWQPGSTFHYISGLSQSFKVDQPTLFKSTIQGGITNKGKLMRATFQTIVNDHIIAADRLIPNKAVTFSPGQIHSGSYVYLGGGAGYVVIPVTRISFVYLQPGIYTFNVGLICFEGASQIEMPMVTYELMQFKDGSMKEIGGYKLTAIAS